MDALSRDLQSQQSLLSLPGVQPSRGVEVAGNTISWPSDGWYEVQYASSYNTVSEGGQSATLDPGVYNVINHSTGERFENITISQDNLGVTQRSSMDTLRDSPTTTDMLSGSNAMDYGPGGIKDGYPPSTITTTTPESNFGEVARDAGRDAIAAGYGAFRGGARHPLLIGEIMLGAAVLSTANNVDAETVPNPDAVPNSSRYGNNGEVSSTESAVNANFGTAEQGEFGGLEDTYPSDPEPVTQPTTTRPTRDPNRNSDSDTDNGPGGGGVSSSQSASDGGYGNSPGGEFG